VLDRADAMSNDQHGSAVPELLKCILDYAF
jgi:hypothetical protein